MVSQDGEYNVKACYCQYRLESSQVKIDLDQLLACERSTFSRIAFNQFDSFFSITLQSTSLGGVRRTGVVNEGTNSREFGFAADEFMNYKFAKTTCRAEDQN